MIAFLQGAPAFGAVERVLVDLVEGLRGEREEIAVVYPDVPALAPLARLDGGNVRTVAFPSPLLGAPVPLLVPRLARLLRRLRPRLVHVFDVWPPGQVAARLAGVPRLLLTHHTPELPRRDNLAGRLWWRLGWLTRPVVIYTSEADRATDGRALESYVVPCGIDLERFRRRPVRAAGSAPVIGNVARLSAQKGQCFLVEAAPLVLERYPHARFVLVGDGELRGELEELTGRLGVERSFELAGDREDVPELLASFDVFAFPSLFEGLCLAVIEAQAVGVPVVASPVGGIRETVVDGVTGLRCPPRAPAALAERILWLLEHRAEAERMADEAWRRVELRFPLERMREGMRALYFHG